MGQAAYFDATRGGIISRAALGGSSRGRLLVGGAALARLTQSLGAEWVPEGAWAAEERAQVEAVLGAFIAQHVR